MMNNLSSYLLIFALLVSGSCLAISWNDSLYNNPIYKQSVDYDAPVIDGEKTLELLKQLKDIIPKHDKEMQKDLANLIYISEEVDSDCYNTLLRNNVNINTNSLSSKEKNKHYGANILAYMDYCGGKAIKYCKNKLELVVNTEISNSDKAEIEKLISDNVVYPKNKDEYYDIKEKQSINYSLKYLQNNIDDFDRKIKKAKTRTEIVDKYIWLTQLCKRFNRQLQPDSFIETAISHYSLYKYIFEDNFLIKWETRARVCYFVGNKISSDQVIKEYFGDSGIPLETKDKVKNFFSLGGGGARSGSDSSGYYVSSMSYAMAN